MNEISVPQSEFLEYLKRLPRQDLHTLCVRLDGGSKSELFLCALVALRREVTARKQARHWQKVVDRLCQELERVQFRSILETNAEAARRIAELEEQVRKLQRKINGGKE